MGIIYLVQPAVLIGTNRFKIGCSSKSNLSRVRNGYRNGTRYLHIMECDKPFEVEKVMKEEFNSKFNLIAGTEFFEGDEITIKRLFYKVYERVIYDVDEDNVSVNNVNTEIHNNKFECGRCGYTTKRKYNLIQHLKSKRICDPVLLDMERKYLLLILGEKKYTPGISKNKHIECFECLKCDRFYTHKENMCKHKNHHIKTRSIDDAINKLIEVRQQANDALKTNIELTKVRIEKEKYIKRLKQIENTITDE